MPFVFRTTNHDIWVSRKQTTHGMREWSRRVLYTINNSIASHSSWGFWNMLDMLLEVILASQRQAAIHILINSLLLDGRSEGQSFWQIYSLRNVELICNPCVHSVPGIVLSCSSLLYSVHCVYLWDLSHLDLWGGSTRMPLLSLARAAVLNKRWISGDLQAHSKFGFHEHIAWACTLHPLTPSCGSWPFSSHGLLLTRWLHSRDGCIRMKKNEREDDAAG